MDKIAVFIEHYSIGNSPSIINLLDFLSDNYRVDLYLRHVGLKDVNILKKQNIHVIEVSERGALRYNRDDLKTFFNYRKEKLGTFFLSYKSYLCFDPHGFILCKDLFPRAQPIYYSLELYMKDDHFGLYYPKDIMDKERNMINSIKGLIIQSEEKESLFRGDYGLSDKIPALIVPVTYQGPAINKKSDFIRGKYSIDNNKRIALHLGGIAKWHSCIEIAMAFSKLRGWVLLFQGYPNVEYLGKLQDTLVRKSISNVIVSDKIYDSLEETDRIIASCDLGIAWYNDVSIGFRTAGKSSGKIPAYLRFGLPVIVKEYPSTLEAIQHTGCGICVGDYDEIPTAIDKIEKNYSKYSSNALEEYNQTYQFENYKEELLGFIES